MVMDLNAMVGGLEMGVVCLECDGRRQHAWRQCCHEIAGTMPMQGQYLVRILPTLIAQMIMLRSLGV